MSTKIEIEANSDRELVLCRLLDAPVEKIYRGWADPTLLKQWFAPRPWTVARIENEFRTGGPSTIVMKSPEGQEFPGTGMYLEIIPNQKIVFTDAFTSGWTPSAKPFMVATVTLEAQGAQTKYTVRVQHWTKADCEQHAQMGFHQGWSQCADQLEELARKL